MCKQARARRLWLRAAGGGGGRMRAGKCECRAEVWCAAEACSLKQPPSSATRRGQRDTHTRGQANVARGPQQALGARLMFQGGQARASKPRCQCLSYV